MLSANDFFAHMRRLNPEYVSVFESEDDGSFHEAVERLIQRALRTAETSRQEYRRLPEPGLSRLVSALLAPATCAAPERHRNGHVDIVVEHPRGLPLTYLVECKIWDGHARHRGGMRQLLGYATSYDRRAMCLAFFVNHQKMVFLLERLRVDVDADADLPAIPPSHACEVFPGAFVSSHRHQSGTVLEIVHVGCDLYEEPAA